MIECKDISDEDLIRRLRQAAAAWFNDDNIMLLEELIRRRVDREAMTHFIARFPQHSTPISNPKPQDYLEAARWYRSQYGNSYLGMRDKAEAFERVYRRLKWARETWLHCRPNEGERAG
jgi:hypothetical protein